MTQTATKSNKMTLFMLTASIAGNMMGSGMFLLPATLSGIGSISIFGWLLSMIGASMVALVFAKLAMIIPKAGGPYAFTRQTYGNYLSFQTAFVYWVGAWIGNIAVAIVAIGYLSFFFPILHNPFIACICGISLIWFFISLNMFGARFMGRVQVFTTSIMLIPVLSTAIFGWFFFDSTIFMNSFRVNDIGNFDAITRSAAMTLWAFLGVETACVNAGVVENPAKTIPIATLLGVAIAGTVYILSSSVIMGIIPQTELVNSNSPFSLLATKIIGPTAGAFVSVCAIVTCFGTLSGWTLVMSQISKAAADDNLFPKIFSRVNKKNAAYYGLIISGILITFLYFITIVPKLGEHFTTISETTVFMIVLPYLYSCAALFVILRTNKFQKKTIFLYSIIIVMASIYTLSAIIGLGQKIVFYGALTMFLTVLLYIYPALKKSHRVG